MEITLELSNSAFNEAKELELSLKLLDQPSIFAPEKKIRLSGGTAILQTSKGSTFTNSALTAIY
jgi:hypothetical protein